MRKRKIRAIDSYITISGAATIEGVAAECVFLDNFEIKDASSHTHSLPETRVNATPFGQLC